ncbi:sarcosine oxidase [Spinactinospora alkalitolerans]|uniref:Sarcosine oxidase n=1 Tax=Spinactinospora alkalitolerans TaxID=687207 RepID=A0A852U0M2_9ACTN|nr:N-methyl-L-tryptophan oxidase [Spinactinospora alkalitolerans]NYE47744.1 sarcosine oxidase [Spinactinospora alkalitolerans]
MQPPSAPRVGIVGAGTMGTMAAWRLADRGADVIAFDRYAPGHDRGAAGGESRIFRTAYMEGGRYVPLLRRSEELWRELEEQTGRDLLRMCGGLTIGPPGHPSIRELRSGAERHGLDHAVLTPREAAERFPQHPLGPGEIAVLDPCAGVVRPDIALSAAALRAEELGARIRRYAPVEACERRGGRWVLRAGGDEHEVDHVVLAPGPWSSAPGAPAADLLSAFGLRGRQITLCWFPARDPAALTPDRNPVVIRVGDLAYSCFPVMDGVSVKVSSHTAARAAVTDPSALPRSATAELLSVVRDTVRVHLPELHRDPNRIATYADAFTPDGHALLGPVPGRPGLVLATGFSGHGFKLSPLFGEVIADLALDGRTRHDIAHLDPARLL